MENAKSYHWTVSLPAAAIFLSCSLFLQTKKAIWVDECYSYYGITHKNPDAFLESIYSGINFSPPLYFMMNWILQLIVDIPIELLRVESSLWICLGFLLIFLKCDRVFGFIPALVGCTMVLLQSDLLLGQSLEARHYGMFFACSAGVLFMFPRDSKLPTSNHKVLYFAAHLALCLTHYLGIAFSVLAAVVRLWDHREEDGFKRLFLSPEIICYAITIPIYLHLLAHQSSHLGDWFRPNDLPTLLSAYLNSLSPLTLLPLIVTLAFIPSKHLGKKNKIEGEQKGSFRPLVRVVILWFLVPLFLWILSNCTKINLFTDRYFIPKEAAFMILVSFGISKLMRRLGELKPLPARIVLLAPCLVSFGIFTLNAKRIHFSYHPSLNYHHWLLIQKEQRKIIGEESIVYQGDHLFFPNLYSEKNAQHFLLINEPELQTTYAKFSSKINCMQKDSLRLLDNFHFISSDGELPKTFDVPHSMTPPEHLSENSPAVIRSYFKNIP